METLSDWEGRLIGGRYELREYIAKGGFGHVFKAWDCTNNCWVAIKIATVNPGQNTFGDTKVNRLKREVVALKKLDDSRIVRLLDSGKEAGFGFAALEFLDGVNLSSYIDSVGHKGSKRLCVHIIIQLLEAIGVAHKAGLIHRDIKPENVMVTSDGLIKLIDFGIVTGVHKPGKRKRRVTPLGVVLGTPGYLSPEQAHGKRLDLSSDLYNCGLVLFELLTRELPFPARHGKVNVEAMERKMSSFFKLCRVSGKVQNIIRKALQEDPALRFQTAEEMRLALVEAVRPFSFRRFVKSFWSRICSFFRLSK